MLFHLAGALDDLYEATIAYNMFYSGETYSSPLHMAGYLLTFPILHARLDALWFLGGLGCAVLLFAGLQAPARWVAPLWVAAACLSIAVNGSRGLPQYFLQAGPPMALAAGWGAVLVWHRTTPIARIVLIALLSIGAARVTSFDKAIDYTAYDLRAWTGRADARAVSVAVRRTRLGRQVFGAGDSRTRAAPAREGARRQRVLLFGFSPGALVQSQRVSATRFFWSRPVIVGFNEGKPGYGVVGPARRTRSPQADRSHPAAARLGSRRPRLLHVLPRSAAPRRVAAHALRAVGRAGKFPALSPHRPVAASNGSRSFKGLRNSRRR